MATIKEILEIEQSRETAAEWRKIHLFQEGSFYRAYEVSALLRNLKDSTLKLSIYPINFMFMHRELMFAAREYVFAHRELVFAVREHNFSH